MKALYDYWKKDGVPKAKSYFGDDTSNSIRDKTCEVIDQRGVIYYAILTDFFYNKQNKKDYRPSWLCFFAPELPVRAFEPVQRTAKKSS